MSAPLKNHKPSGVDHVRVSEGSRDMAKQPVLKFADTEQEMHFWKKELVEVQTALSQLNVEMKLRLGKVSLRFQGKEFSQQKMLIETEFSALKEPLHRRKTEIELKYRDVKLRRQQEYERNFPPEAHAHNFAPLAVNAFKELIEQQKETNRLLTELLTATNQTNEILSHSRFG